MVSTGGNEGTWRKYIPLAGLISLAVFLGLKRKHAEPSQDGKAPPPQSDDATKTKPPSHKYRHYSHPSEEEHRTAEQYSWRYSYILNVGIAVAAVLTVIFAAGSFIETRREADIAATSNRAWIDIQGSIQNTRIHWFPNGSLEAAIPLQAVNQGNSPALNVFMDIIWEIPQGSQSDADRDIKDACFSDKPYQTNLIFPKTPSAPPQWYDADASPDKVKFWFQRHWVVNRSPYIAEKGFRIKYFTDLELALCASYNIVGDDKVHHTINVFQIFMPPVGFDLPEGTGITPARSGDYAD